MNVLFLTYSYLPELGGVQRSVHNLTNLLGARGHRMLVATHAPSRLGIGVRRSRKTPVLCLNIPSPFQRVWTKALPARLLDILNQAALLAFCWFHRVRIVHCHLINVDTRYATFLARALRVKVVLTLRGGETEHWMETHPIRRDYVAGLLREAGAVTAVARSLVDQAEQLVPGIRDRSTVIPNPIHWETLSRIAAEERSPGERFILFAGRLEPMKDVACLVEAVHRILEIHPEFPLSLLIVGEGSLESELRKKAREGPGQSRIRFLGARGYLETLRLIRDAEMLVLPSKSSEGCPNVVIEAMVMETPVVVSSLAALVELVAHGRTGLVFPMGDGEKLSRAIIALAENRELGRSIAGAAREQVAQRHEPERIVSAIEEVYRRMMRS